MAGKRRCWKCRKVSEVKGMMYDILGRDLICPDCLRAEKRGGKEKERERTEAITANAATGRGEQRNVKSDSDDESNTISYQCGSCGLGFSEEKGARIRCCPYCRKGNFRVAFRDSAQRLIEEAAKEKFED